MIDTKVNINDNNQDSPISNNYDAQDCDQMKDVDVSDDIADKALYLISENKNKSPTSLSLSSTPCENPNYEQSIQYKGLNNSEDTSSSINCAEFAAISEQNEHNDDYYESEESEESESDSEFSTEDEDSSDENDPDQANNSIMQERWKELDKYGLSSHILHTQPNGEPPNPANLYRMSAPINLSANHQLSDPGPPSSEFLINNPPMPDEPYHMGMNTHVANNALNMSMRHMSSMQSMNKLPPTKNTHLHPMENDPHFHMVSQKPFKSDPLHCRLPHPNPNMHLNHSAINFDYSKQPRHPVNPQPYPVSDMRSQFHISMMMNGQGNVDVDPLPIHPISHPHIQDFRCNYCNKCYTNQSSLRSHLKKHMNIDEKKYKCEKCSYSSQYQKNLLKHMHINHAEINDTQHCRCDICDRMFASEFLLKDHLRMHTNDNTYQCQQCCKKLKTKLKLRYHADVHNPEKPYVCDIDNCDRAFRTPKYLKNHKDEFHKLQPKKHFCPVDTCKLVFQRKSHLKRHMAMHDGEKNYHCHWPDCNRSFRTQETLNVHLIRHTGEKPFKCELCEYSCRQKASLNYHCRNAHAKDCERLLGLKPISNDCRPPGTRPVGRPPRNRSDPLLECDNQRHESGKFDANSDENDCKLESKIESDVNGIISNLEKDPNIIDIFKKPAPVEENDLLRKEVFMIVDEVLSSPPRYYGDIDEFSLEELCTIELSIKSKRGRKRKVLKELDALLAMSLSEAHTIDDDDSLSYKEDCEDDVEPPSPISNTKSQYIPSLVQSTSNNNSNCMSSKNNNRPLSGFSDIQDGRITPEIMQHHHNTPPDNSKRYSMNMNPSKKLTNRITSYSSSNHTNGVSSFDANYILNNNNNNNSCGQDQNSLSRSNSPVSGHIKVDDAGSGEDITDNIDSQPNSINQLSPEPANLSCQKRNILSPKREFLLRKSPDRKLLSNMEIKNEDESNIHGFQSLQKQFENPLSALSNLENLKMNKDLLDQVLEDLKVIQNDEDHRQKTFLSPNSAATVYSSNNSFRNISELNSTSETGSKVNSKLSNIPHSLKISTNENHVQPKSLDSSLWSDSGYSSGHDSSGLNKDNTNMNQLNPACSNMSVSSISDRGYKIPSPSSSAAAAFIEKTAAAAEMAALSASAALLNSDFYNSYQQNMSNNRTSTGSNYNSYDGPVPGLTSELTNMSNICSSMYKNGLEDHLRSLTALGSKYMENGGYQGSNRSDSNSGPDANSMGAFSNFWSSASVSSGDYLSITSNGGSGGSSLNPFDPTNVRNGIGDYCNLAQSPTVAAAADLYSQMAASANYDKYSSLYGCRDSFYGNSGSSSRGLNNGDTAFPINSNHYVDRSYLSSNHPFYPQSVSDQYNSRYPPASATDYLSVGRQFSSGGPSSGNPFAVGSDPYRNSMLHNMSPFNRYPF